MASSRNQELKRQIEMTEAALRSNKEERRKLKARLKELLKLKELEREKPIYNIFLLPTVPRTVPEQGPPQLQIPQPAPSAPHQSVQFQVPSTSNHVGQPITSLELQAASFNFRVPLVSQSSSSHRSNTQVLPSSQKIVQPAQVLQALSPSAPNHSILHVASTSQQTERQIPSQIPSSSEPSAPRRPTSQRKRYPISSQVLEAKQKRIQRLDLSQYPCPCRNGCNYCKSTVPASVNGKLLEQLSKAQARPEAHQIVPEVQYASQKVSEAQTRPEIRPTQLADEPSTSSETSQPVQHRRKRADWMPDEPPKLDSDVLMNLAEGNPFPPSFETPSLIAPRLIPPILKFTPADLHSSARKNLLDPTVNPLYMFEGCRKCLFELSKSPTLPQIVSRIPNSSDQIRRRSFFGEVAAWDQLPQGEKHYWLFVNFWLRKEQKKQVERGWIKVEEHVVTYIDVD